MLRAAAGLAGLLLALVVASAEAGAEERITSFESDIRVNVDGTIEVVETIEVIAERDRIRRGIFREFPTDYLDRFGNRVRVRFDVVAVRRDGDPEPYHLASTGNGTRVYIGDEDVLIGRGRHVYEIAYVTDRQLGYFDDFDELYWNATGNEWEFPIDEAVAIVRLPGDAPIVQHAAYTGALGARGQDFVFDVLAGGTARFRTTRMLSPGEGLTIAVAWPKGYVTQPTAADRAGYVLRDNLGALIGLVGLALLLGYYYWAWRRVGRDPPAGTVIPLFEPPKGFSAAACRHVMRMGYDTKAFTAAILAMAVKGYLTVDETADGYAVTRTGDPDSPLTPGERAVARKLFAGGDHVDIGRGEHKRIKGARDALSTYLKANFEKEFFRRNLGILVPGLALSALILVAIVVTAADLGVAAFLAVWIGFWTIGCVALGAAVIASFRVTVLRGLISLAFASAFYFAEIMGLYFFSTVTSAAAAILLVAVAAASALFHRLMRAPTRLGRRIMDEIEGFKLYLSVAEKERFATLNPPERTPELFERYFPYALALDVENEWAEKFVGVLEAAAAERGQGAYRPSWYRGYGHDGFDSATMASRLGGGFAGAMASAASPGSSSGSGGGGSSGGGGGGGGGGGW